MSQLRRRLTGHPAIHLDNHRRSIRSKRLPYLTLVLCSVNVQISPFSIRLIILPLSFEDISIHVPELPISMCLPFTPLT